MSLKNIDITAGLRHLADKRIEEAMKQGKFDNLEGAGKPLDLEPMPAEENSRMNWWAIRILRQNNVVPDEIRWRKLLDTLRSELVTAADEERVRKLVRHINDLVMKINTLGTNALKTAVVGVSLENELERLEQRTNSHESRR